MLRKFINFLRLLPVVCVLGIHLLGLFPQVHPLFDTFANLRLLTTPLLIFMAFGLVMRERGLWALISFLSALVGVFSFGIEVPAIAPPQGNFRLVQIDLGAKRIDDTKIASWLVTAKPDVISLRSDSSRDILLPQSIAVDFPAKLVCQGVMKEQIMLLSRTPMREAHCSLEPGLGWAEINVLGKSLQIASIALDYPYPSKQWQQLKAFDPDLRALKQPLILAAHLNSMPWANGAVQIAAASGTLPASGPVFTLQAMRIPALPLMQIFAGPRLNVSNVHVGDDVGSTYLPIIADFKL